ncbi:amino acid dehydrogenase [Alicyclobacillus ferrooxydans]|uniref:Amino acid dehydrogenase n=1 Tax=Alicyclobacillus ferrooxydans TaxID=471514 RepID=A0A0P9CAN9_9BACL|nr:amino acid dehydrogenase [Alicyclobacillus ferrooxydans]
MSNPYRRRTVAGVQDHFANLRREVFTELGNPEEWRARAAQIRTHTIANLDAYLEQFTDNVTRHGGHVHFAADAADANAYITRLAREKRARTIVKSKSMVTEEIGLNHALEHAGAEVIETDLGEFILQLDHDKPSHIVGPALHKSKAEIAEIFSRHAGHPIAVDTDELAAYARKYLRDKFFAADMGITGCNFGVAESGSVVIVSNEGNARMTSSLPKVHVVVMGMERLVPSFADLDILLTLLPKVASGQRTISYVTAIHGPKQAPDLDGPEELHIVIVDNGRSNMLGTEYQQALNCIRCGNCSNVCPVYRHAGGHAYGGVYNGPIGAIITPLMEGIEKWKDLPYASSLCGACTDACPVKIPLHEYLVALRRDISEAGIDSWGERMAAHLFGWGASHPGAFSMGQSILKTGLTATKVGPLGGWKSEREFPSSAGQTFREWWHKEGEREGERER